MLQSFLEKETFAGIVTRASCVSMWVAIRYNIPLIIWGEPSSEYTAYYSYEQAEEVDEGEALQSCRNLGITADVCHVRMEAV